MQKTVSFGSFFSSTTGNSRRRCFLLLLLVLVTSLRSFALPLTASGHGELATNSPAMQVAHDERGNRLTMSCHEDTTPDSQAMNDSAPTKSCQILCDLASAPLLPSAEVTPLRGGVEIRFTSPIIFNLGTQVPPDHPPPIA